MGDLRRSVRSLRTARRPVRYITALSIGAAALATTVGVYQVIGRPSSSLLFAATLLIAWLLGFGPAVVVAAIGVVVIDRLVEPAVRIWQWNVDALAWMLLFGLTMLGMAWLASGIRTLEDERQHLLDRERQARLEAETANRAKDDFLAVVSHELRNPLTAILGWLKVLRDSRVTGHDAERALETIERNALLQARLIDDLLDVARAVNGKLEIRMRPVNLGRLVTEATAILHPKTRTAGLVLETAIDRDILIYGDEMRLQQAVLNLVSNAIKFTPRGRSIRVEAHRDDRVARVAVIDSGIGIAADALPHVFDAFYQERAARTPREGLGLGLAIVKDIVEQHGGSIVADSAGPGAGASFTVTLPIAG